MRPINAYNRYMQMSLPKFREQNPELGREQIFRLAAAKVRCAFRSHCSELRVNAMHSGTQAVALPAEVRFIWFQFDMICGAAYLETLKC